MCVHMNYLYMCTYVTVLITPLITLNGGTNLSFVLDILSVKLVTVKNIGRNH